MSHYQVLRKLIFDLLYVKFHQESCILALNDFVKDMPKYPDEIIHPFSLSAINKLKSIAPKVFLVINLINPQLIPSDFIDYQTDDTYNLIRMVLKEYNQDRIDKLIEQISTTLTPEKITANENLLAKMFEQLILNNNCSHTVLSLLNSLLPVIPSSLLFLKIPDIQTENLLLLIPLSLISPSEINITILSNIQLIKFSYLVIENMQEKLTTESVIPLHRLTLSGSSAIEAVVFSLRRLPQTFSLFRKKAQFDARVAFGAVLNCILTCVEIPELKHFVQENNVRIVKYFTSLCSSVTSVSISRSFTHVLTLFNMQGILPIYHVYSCWLGKPRKYLILHCLRTISPLDPSLPALLNEIEISQLIAQFPFLICQIAQKVIFSHSVANIIALQNLATTIEQGNGINDFINFTASIFNHELYFYAVHVISLFNQNPDFTNEEVKKSIEKIVLISILTESFYSARHLDRFARWLPYLDEESLCSILSRCQKEKYRVNCRLILMFTYMPDFARNMIFKSNFFSLFVKYISQIFIMPLNKISQDKLDTENDPEFVSKYASLCISWHNFYISIYEHKKTISRDKNISDMFSIGAKTLVKLWNNPSLHKLIANSFCDAVLLEETRKIIINVIGKTQTEDDEEKFFDFLMSIDEKSVKEKFPELKNVFVTKKIEKPPPTRWGFAYWYALQDLDNFAFGQEMSVKI